MMKSSDSGILSITKSMLIRFREPNSEQVIDEWLKKSKRIIRVQITVQVKMKAEYQENSNKIVISVT